MCLYSIVWMANSTTFGDLWQKPTHQLQSFVSYYMQMTALVAQSAEEMQHIVSCFNNAAVSFGLQINIEKTECLFQPAPEAETTADDIFVSGEALKKVSTFSYLGSVISDDCTVNNDIATCLQKANKSYGALQKRLWSQRGIKVKTKIKVYKAVILITLLYGSQSWTLYRRNTKELGAKECQ